MWLRSGLPQGTGTLVVAVLGGACWHKQLLEVTSSLTIEPVDFRTGWSQAKELTGREHNLTHEQTIGLKIYTVVLPTKARPRFLHS